ncbi:hypothetical protein AALB16_03785 [Lachnospiraceae bacterium 62-35]
MNSRLIIDGNAVYEIDEDCMNQRRESQTGGYEKETKAPWTEGRGMAGIEERQERMFSRG